MYCVTGQETKGATENKNYVRAPRAGWRIDVRIRHQRVILNDQALGYGTRDNQHPLGGEYDTYTIEWRLKFALGVLFL